MNAKGLKNLLKEKVDRSQVARVSVLILPLLVMMGYQPTFIKSSIHAFSLLLHGGAIASGHLYTHSCLLVTNWTRLWYGPLTYYLLAPFLAVFPDILTLYAVSGILAVAGALLLYRFCDEFFDRNTAYISLWVYSTLAYIPNLLREPIEQVYLPFFYVLAVYSLFKLRFKRQWGYFVPLCIAIAFNLQNHVSAIPIVLLMVFIPWRGFLKHRRHLWIGLGIFFLLFLPYLMYLYEDRAWISGISFQALSGIESGGEESMVHLRHPYSLEELKTRLTEPVELILKGDYHYNHFISGPLVTRRGIEVYWGIFLVLVPVALTAVIISFGFRHLLKNAFRIIDMRHYALAILWITAMLWISLFPYHESRHLIFPYIISTIFIGLCITQLGSLFRSRAYYLIMGGVLAFAGLASLIAFIITVHSTIQAGYAPTVSGLPYLGERALSHHIAEQYPGLRGVNILLLDTTSGQNFVTHDLYFGPKGNTDPHTEQEWREGGGCGPRAKIPFISRARFGEVRPEDASYESTFLLLSARDPVVPGKNGGGTHKVFRNISIVEVDGRVIGTANIAIVGSEDFGAESLMPKVWYNLSIPQSRVDTRTFPPLETNAEFLTYNYRFNAAGGSRTLVFVNRGEFYVSSSYSLDGDETRANREFPSGASFFLNVSRGEHQFAVTLRLKPQIRRGPADPFELYLFDLGEESI